MSQTIVDPRVESLFSRLFRNVVPSLLTRLTEHSTFSYWRMTSDLYFQHYSVLAKSTKSAYRYRIKEEIYEKNIEIILF